MTNAPEVVVLLHGYEGNEPDHWQTWLAQQLVAAGVPVRYPELPDPFHPDLDRWAEATAAVLEADPAAGRVVVAHSLACHLWAHLAAGADSVLADRVLLVAPPGLRETTENFPGLGPGPIQGDVLRRAAPATELVLGEGDPWRASATDFAAAGVPVLVVPGGGHLNVAAGLGPWPDMLDRVIGRAEVPPAAWVGG